MNIFTKKNPDSLSPEDRKQMAIELSNSYLNIMNSFAWRDLDALLDKIAADSVTACDECDIKDLTAASIGHLRGVRETIRKIRKHIDFSVNGLSRK